ncbi:MAG: response regulator transcription factor [Acidimicrobiales bacterium]|jgi:DNA-binding NarL/FixJ family response regulator|nr:response regulator transcription factor [Acidimicrobiales bacterium]
MIRVLIADDHPVVRRGVTELLAAAGDIEVIGAAVDGAEAVALAATHRPDVVLMDISMPNVDGIEATRTVVAAWPEAKVVALTSFDDRDRIVAVLDAGAVGYLLKDAEPEELLRGVRAAARGESPLDPKAARVVLSARPQPHAAEGSLTAREREVLGLVAGGLANKAIARRMGISEKTVKAHLTSVFARIGVTDRTQAALWARDHGIGS